MKTKIFGAIIFLLVAVLVASSQDTKLTMSACTGSDRFESSFSFDVKGEFLNIEIHEVRNCGLEWQRTKIGSIQQVADSLLVNIEFFYGPMAKCICDYCISGHAKISDNVKFVIYRVVDCFIDVTLDANMHEHEVIQRKKEADRKFSIPGR